MKNNVLHHLVAWLCFWLFMLLVRGNESASWESTLYAVLIMCLSYTYISYVNFALLIHYFEKQRYALYFLLNVFNLLITNALMYMPLSLLQPEQVYFFQTLISLFFALVISGGVYFIRSGFFKQIQLQEARTRQREAEMELLKMQIQPHFLFNALNNLYASNIRNPENTNTQILQLADLLRYQLEMNKKEKIGLEEEIHMVENYIALEKIRMKDSAIKIEKRGNFQGLQIVPLLLFPLIENAFKHSAGIAQVKQIEIRFEAEGNNFTFFCKNNKRMLMKQDSMGLGLENVRKRLEAFYTNRFQLEIHEEAQYFELNLTIRLL